ncbi:MAG: FoF1 ATP synthase subunit gamma [Candidatus Margulisiibacteriota bacterium]|mgnify:CR=1 FL=1
MADILGLKRRLQNINAVYEITDAMEVIATIIIGRAQKFLEYRREIQSYHDRLYLSRELKRQHKDSQESWVIAFFSEKGFSGNFNPMIVPTLNRYKTHKNVIVVGSRGKAYCERIGLKHAHFVEGASKLPTDQLIEPVFQILKDHGFPRNTKVIFNRYANMFVQIPTDTVFFPEPTSNYTQIESKMDMDSEVFDQLALSKYVKSKLFYFYAQNFAGEVAAKLLMMKNATESAQKLKQEITRDVFKARQAKITQELSEVVSAYKVLQSVNERR